MSKFSKKLGMALVATAMLTNFSVFAESSSGTGLFFEAFGSYGLSPERAAGWQRSANTTDPQTYAAIPGSKGIGFGLNVGYEFISNLAGVLGYNFQSLTTKVDISQGAGSSVFTNYEITTTSHYINLGLRPMVKALAGTIYAGGGLLLGLPTNYKQVETTTGNAVAANNTTITYEGKLNMVLGFYGEMGYTYSINQNLSIGLGARINVAHASNNGKDWTYSSTSTTNTVSTVKYTDSVAASCTTTTTSCQKPETYSLTNTQIQLVVGYKL